jgi:hypothetical protein
MIAVINTLVFQLGCVILFSYLYWNYVDDFVPAITNDKNKQKKAQLIDCFYTSITIQSGVGYNGLDPINNRGKILLMIQQIVMICANVFIFFLFSKHLLNIHHYKKNNYNFL